VKLNLFLIAHHTITTSGRVEYSSPHSERLYLMYGVSFTPRPLQLRRKSPQYPPRTKLRESTKWVLKLLHWYTVQKKISCPFWESNLDYSGPSLWS